MGLAVPLMLPALFMTFSWAAFPLPYSVFGPLERSPVPDQPPHYTATGLSAQVGRLNLNGPFVQVDVLPAGLALRFFGQSAFIARERFVACERLRFGRTKVVHDSPEIRSPLVIGDGRLADALDAVWPHKGAPPAAAWPAPWPPR